MKAVRCAIYTRKSSEEGLEQDFNSLDAQREACGAYILSQASEGWTALPDIYDDGGISGGTIERPALKRLLAEVNAGRIDIIVVYKVDRLTRSLLDFSRLVEAFDKADTSFVSVTQSFNTTTSMGRLTLNMLLSFAQFEREVTAERIRDKLAASKAKGMWMGGTPPLGYRPDGRTLEIVQPDADIVRDIYRRYLAFGNVRLVAEQLERDGVRAPVRATSAGKPFGGGRFSRGQLYTMLKNPIYIGKIAHHEHVFDGLHQAIIDDGIWDRAQAMLADNLQGKHRARRASPNLLAGKIIDAEGEPLVVTHANKGTTRYRYYVSRALQHVPGSTGMRIPAAEIETAICQRLAALFEDPFALAATASLLIVPSELERCAALCGDLHAAALRRDPNIVADIVRQVRVHDSRIEISCDAEAIAAALRAEREADVAPDICITSAVRLGKSGRVLRLVSTSGAAISAQPNQAVVGLLLKARRWWELLRVGDIDINQLAAREGITRSYLTRVVRLAFLSPRVVSAILAGDTLAKVNVAALTVPDAFPECWATQERDMLVPG